GLRELAAARAEPAEDVTRGWYPLLRRLSKHAGVTRADRQRQIGGARKTERRETWSIIPRADREHGVGVRQEECVDDRVDDGPALMLVADPETQVQYQRQIALGGVACRVIHRPHHAAVDGDTAARVVGDLETHDLRARRDAGEPADVVEVVTGCNPRHVRAMPRRIEEQI